ncbi:pyridoxamine 5'-phosphate oxidase family protein [Deminuibacter soli]|uniref:General stress protein FMN-binding split barrel domain-containing protein n=1 Tax=Deminuibacter soli TaxID=2291815 RepID=A0A3E1NL03_9BACT|nr:pyridoxamine 5'-phosphate oxidase family protein [Deminuibacter soli]RFM28619.1 hypothetical protein DXN05_07435 [Deminuibacter soli]
MLNSTNTREETAKSLTKFKKLVLQSRVCMLCGVTLSGEIVTKPLYTASVDEAGDLYFYFNEDAQGLDAINWNNNISLIYSNSGRRTHLEVTGKSVMIMDRQKTRDLWSPLLHAYFPKGSHSMKLMKVHVTRAACYQDFHSQREVLIQAPIETPHTDQLKKTLALQKVG